MSTLMELTEELLLYRKMYQMWKKPDPKGKTTYKRIEARQTKEQPASKEKEEPLRKNKVTTEEVRHIVTYVAEHIQIHLGGWRGSRRR